jgi:predicted aspartyl protease
MEQRAITHKKMEGGLLSQIICEVMVTAPFVGEQDPAHLPSVKALGLWDTGATGSVITKRIADQIGLKPSGRQIVNHANGTDEVNTYLINLVLPSNVVITGVKATEGKLTGFDVLIGMDVITLGDFSITNHQGNTVMSFRVPSSHEIDYVALTNEHNTLMLKRAQQQQLAKYLPRPKKGKKRK